jgi:PST family polysaccharide transporter
MQPFSQAAYPRSHRLMAESREDGLRFTRRLLLIQGGVAALVSLVLFCAAPLIISIIAGPRYAAAVAVLRILSVVPFLVALSNVLGLHMMLPLDMKTAFSRILMASAVLNSMLIFPLNWFFGAIGAATCTVASEIFVTALMGIWLWQKNILQIGKVPNG